MFGFFNKKDDLKAGLQIVNLLALGLATYDWFTNPQAKTSELYCARSQTEVFLN